MTMTFQIRTPSQRTVKPSHKTLSDVRDLGLAEDQFITAEDLAEQEAIPRESVLKILDAQKVWPKAKIINRGSVTSTHPHGKPLGGRPKLAFDPDAASAAVLVGIEEMYGSD